MSHDLDTWAFLGESWRDPTVGVLPRPKFGHGAMCPYYAQLDGKVVMKALLVGGGEVMFVGNCKAGGNDSERSVSVLC